MNNTNFDRQSHASDEGLSMKAQYKQTVILTQICFNQWYVEGRNLQYLRIEPKDKKARIDSKIKNYLEIENLDATVADLLRPSSNSRCYNLNNLVLPVLSEAFVEEAKKRQEALDNQVSYTRLLNVLVHPFSHTDSPVERVTSTGNTQRSNFLIDFCMLSDIDGGLSIEELLIVRTLMKSRINFVLKEDFTIEKFLYDKSSKPDMFETRVREMLYLAFCFQFVADLIECDKCKKLVNKFKIRIANLLKQIEFKTLDIDFFDFSLFTTTFFKSGMEGGGYTHEQRLAIDSSLKRMKDHLKYTQFCEIILNSRSKAENINEINRVFLPQLTVQIKRYLYEMASELPLQIYIPTPEQVTDIISICRGSYIAGHISQELEITEDDLVRRINQNKLIHYYSNLVKCTDDSATIYAINEESGKMAGYIVIVKNFDNSIEVKNLFIAKDLRGSGFGSKLITEVLKNIYPFSKINVRVARHNSQAKSFYTKHGFELVKANYQKIVLTENKNITVDLMVQKQTFAQKASAAMVPIILKAVSELAIRYSNVFSARSG